MTRPVDPPLTPEEQAQVLDLQERLIALLVSHREAVASGDGTRADALQGEIDNLMRQRDHIKMWATGDGK